MAATFLTDVPGVQIGDVTIVPQVVASATTTTGSAVDCLEMEDTVTSPYLTGDNGDATLTATYELKECATSGGAYVSMSPQAIVTLPAGATAQDSLMGMLQGRRSLRYVKGVLITAGAGTLSCSFGSGVFGRKKISGTGNGAKLD